MGKRLMSQGNESVRKEVEILRIFKIESLGK